MLDGFEHDSINKIIGHNGKFFCLQEVKKLRMHSKIGTLDFDFLAEFLKYWEKKTKQQQQQQVNVFFKLNIF